MDELMKKANPVWIVVLTLLGGGESFSAYNSHKTVNVVREAATIRDKMDANMLVAMTEIRELRTEVEKLNDLIEKLVKDSE